MDKSDKISIHAPHEGERPQGSPFVWSEYDFNPRSPRGGATSTLVNPGMEIDISIHAPHEGERLNVSRDKAKNWRAFQSTLPARGSDYGMIYNLSFVINISIHAPREGERLVLIAQGIKAVRISIHAPREGERQKSMQNRLTTIPISIHAPREGERPWR